MTDRRHIRVLSDSSNGKRLLLEAHVELSYIGAASLTAFKLDDIVTGLNSTAVGTVRKILTLTSSTGLLVITLDQSDANTVDKSFTAGENLQVSAATIGQVGTSDSYPIYMAKNTLASSDNPENGVVIDDHGAMYTRFAEGSPQFDAFGKQQVSQQHVLGTYIMSYDELPMEFYDEVVSGASLTYDVLARGITLQCPTTSGAKYERTSHRYHVYQAGISQLLEFTVAAGDEGKANVNRYWGLFDDDNGLRFEMTGLALNVFVRSNTSGTPTETPIPSTTWNRDRLDGSHGPKNPSGVKIDLSKDNVFWIDLQWLGAGSVRYGIIYNGNRIVCHEEHHGNKLNTSYMSTASLPVRYGQENTGIAASTSEFKFFCAVVKAEGKFSPEQHAFSTLVSKSITTTVAEMLVAMRASQLYKGVDNRSSFAPASISIYNAGTEPIIVDIVKGATATLGTWASHGGESAVDLNSTMTSYVGGVSKRGKIIAPGSSGDMLFEAIEDCRMGVRRNADIAQWFEVALTCKLLFAGTGGDVYVTVNWDEIRD